MWILCKVIGSHFTLTSAICHAVLLAKHLSKTSQQNMEPSQQNIRFLIETCRRNNMPVPECHQFICKAWGNDAVSLRTIYRLYEEFSSGQRTSLEDKVRSGRPQSSRHGEIEEIVRELLEDDPHITIDTLMECTNASYGTIQRILTEELQLKWVTAKWVPHMLTQEQKEERVAMAQNILHFFTQHRRNIAKRLVVTDEKWIYHRAVGTKTSNKIWSSKDAERPHVVRRLQHEKKSMITVAFTFTHKFCVDLMPPGETITGDYYIKFLRQMIHNFGRHVEPLHASEMVLMHDNARPHKTASVAHFLEERGIILLPQPPYSPDFNMLDRWVFTMLERKRSCCSFESEADVRAYVTDELRSLSSDDLKYQMEKLKIDLQSIIAARGDYL
jgi:transposase